MQLDDLQTRAKRNEPLSRHTTSRIGGPADLLLEVRSVDELVAALQRADALGLPCTVLGGGANVLVSDAGVRGLVLVNRARDIKFTARNGAARVEVDSGVTLITLARDCIERGYAGFEWAISVPGTVGGAVVGNAGAHNAAISSNLAMAKIMRHGAGSAAGSGPGAGMAAGSGPGAGGAEWWTIRQLAFEYRRSALKAYAPAERPVVLSAIFDLKLDYRANLEKRAAEYVAKRKASQPPGASIGSMFKNPPGDHAGRLIEAAGLKGRRVGGAMISEIHANFFVNVSGDARADDVRALIDLAHGAVLAQSGVDLTLEVELLGAWVTAAARGAQQEQLG